MLCVWFEYQIINKRQLSRFVSSDTRRSNYNTDIIYVGLELTEALADYTFVSKYRVVECLIDHFP